jgi:hypothetical protein
VASVHARHTARQEVTYNNMKTAHTLERLIKKTATPYGTLIERAKRGGMKVERKGDGVVLVTDSKGRSMTLYFENDDIVDKNKDNGLIMGAYHYA